MPRYLHTGSWTNVFHVPGLPEPIEALPGATITLAKAFEHHLLTLIDDAKAEVKKTLAELKAHAAEHGIDLGKAKTKKAVEAVIAAATAPVEPAPAEAQAVSVATEPPAVTPEPTITTDGKE